MAKKVTQLDQRAPLPRLDKVGIYCRVSSATPAQIHSLSAQASFLLRYSLKRWGLGVHDIYIDVGSGGSVEQRPEFMRMLSDIKNGNITQVITKSVSRFGRNTEEILVSYRAIKALGAEVFFELQDLDSRTPDCEMYISLYGGVAQEENRQHSENMKWAIRTRAQDGTSALYNRPCYGYRVNEEGVFEIVQDQASVVREIFSLYIQGLSIVKIKQYLERKGVPSPSGKPAWSKCTIGVILTNKKYIGTSVVYKSYQDGHPQSKRIVNRGTHDFYELSEHHIPIIPAEIFEKAQELRKERTNVEFGIDGTVRRKAKKYTAPKIDSGLE